MCLTTASYDYFLPAEFPGQNGLPDLLERNMAGPETRLYPIVHIRELILSVHSPTATTPIQRRVLFLVNGRHHARGHASAAFREAIVKTIRIYNKDYDTADIRTTRGCHQYQGAGACLLSRKQKTSTSSTIEQGGKQSANYIGVRLSSAPDNYLP